MSPVPTARVRCEVGIVIPAHASALGKALLAFQSDYKAEDLRSMTGETIIDLVAPADELEQIRLSGIGTRWRKPCWANAPSAAVSSIRRARPPGRSALLVSAARWPLPAEDIDGTAMYCPHSVTRTRNITGVATTLGLIIEGTALCSVVCHWRPCAASARRSSNKRLPQGHSVVVTARHRSYRGGSPTPANISDRWRSTYWTRRRPPRRVEAAVQRVGRIDVAVNNAGVAALVAVEEAERRRGPGRLRHQRLESSTRRARSFRRCGRSGRAHHQPVLDWRVHRLGRVAGV